MVVVKHGYGFHISTLAYGISTKQGRLILFFTTLLSYQLLSQYNNNSYESLILQSTTGERIIETFYLRRKYHQTIQLLLSPLVMPRFGHWRLKLVLTRVL